MRCKSAARPVNAAASEIAFARAMFRLSSSLAITLRSLNRLVRNSADFCRSLAACSADLSASSAAAVSFSLAARAASNSPSFSGSRASLGHLRSRPWRAPADVVVVSLSSVLGTDRTAVFEELEGKIRKCLQLLAFLLQCGLVAPQFRQTRLFLGHDKLQFIQFLPQRSGFVAKRLSLWTSAGSLVPPPLSELRQGLETAALWSGAVPQAV